MAETVSLLLLVAARDAARDPAVRTILIALVEQEHSHVLLAWQAMVWMLGLGDASVVAAVRSVFAEPELHIGFGATTKLPGDPAATPASMRDGGWRRMHCTGLCGQRWRGSPKAQRTADAPRATAGP